jgi:hypothetical protein
MIDIGGGNMTGVIVVIDVTKDIVANIGLSFQLNCYSPTGATLQWQQYFFSLQPTTAPAADGSAPADLLAYVNNWNPALTDAVVYGYKSVLSLPDTKIRAGSTLSITLGSEQTTDKINAATFVADIVAADGSKQSGSQAFTLTDLPNVTETDLAPIVSMELDVVGPINSEQALFLSGAGTIGYLAASPLQASQSAPTSAAAGGDFTLETANTVYGPLPTGSNATIQQTFSAVLPPPHVPGGPLAVSQQFGVEQTDVFAVDSAGQVSVLYVGGAGHWVQALPPLGPTGFARRGAAVATSQQFGANNQTDVFVVAQNGQLNVFWVEGTGAWAGPQTIGPGGNAPSGAALATSRQFGATNQTDVFLVDNKGRLNVFWVGGTGAWQGPETIGPANNAPSGAVLAASQQFGLADQTDVFLVDNQGQLNVFWVDGTGAWNGPSKLGPTGLAPAGGGVAASQQFGISDQTDVFLVDNQGQLNVFWVDGGGAWNGPETIGPAGLAPPGARIATSQQFGISNQTDVFLVDNQGQLNVFWVDGSGAWNGPNKLGPTGLAPAGGDVVASQQFGATNKTDVFLLNQTGTDSPGWPMVFWVGGSGSWNGPKALVTEV